ncbi:ferroxidase fet3 [Coemansia sp. RSA 720]|nr:ferroxidase fet3 [Coemansia sp. RSA 720]
MARNRQRRIVPPEPYPWRRVIGGVTLVLVCWGIGLYREYQPEADTYVETAQTWYVRLTWNVTYVDTFRDGIVHRRAKGVNGQVPVPPVYINQGDTLLLTVHNELDVPTSIHSHGLRHDGATYMDGAAMVTQCGIPPGESFTYEIYGAQAGSYWLHGHRKDDVADGLRAPFIILDKYSPYEYDEDVLIYLEDWYPTEVPKKMAEILAPNSVGPPAPTFATGLVNGYSGNDSRPIQFVPGKRYRIRVISMSSTMYWRFTTPGHKLEIIEADGVTSEPCLVDGFTLAPAQRYSAIVTAHESGDFNFIYNCTMYADFIPRIPGLNPRIYTGLIEYQRDAPIKQMEVVGDDQLVWADDLSMHALHGEPALPMERQVVLETRAFVSTERINYRKLGTLPYTEPLVPSLFTAMSMGEQAMDPRVYGPQAQAYVVPLNQSVEILLKNPQGQPHSQHQHGGWFQIIERGPVDRSELEEPPAQANFSLANVPFIPVRRYSGIPMSRDTVDVPPFSYVKLRFRGDNPGVHLHHCHLNPTHSGAGLSITFVVAPDVLQKTLRIPQALYEMCARQGIKTEGNAVGNWGLDMTGLPPVPVELPNSSPRVPLPTDAPPSPINPPQPIN